MIKIEVYKKKIKIEQIRRETSQTMKKIIPIMLVVIILVGGFCAFKIMSFLGCYVRIEDVNECWKLTAW